jgi:hypothetical protein
MGRYRALGLGAGLSCVTLGWLFSAAEPMRWIPFLRNTGYVAIAFGLAMAAGGFLPAWRIRTWLRHATVIYLGTLALLLCLEGLCRALEVDFAALTLQSQRYESHPIYYRQPLVPLRDVFFIRGGPQQWEGRVLNSEMKIEKCLDDGYPDEPVLQLSYDKDGFRNPDSLTDWEICVAGDSFTEAGYLPYEDLFTSVLAARSGLRVRNLGASYTGNLCHAAYVKHFGKAASTRIAVLAFFEGNDVEDNRREYVDLQTFQKRGERPYRELKHQTSLFKHFLYLAKLLSKPKVVPRSLANARWVHEQRTIPMTLFYAPPAPETLTTEEKDALELAVGQWAAGCRELELDAWLLYLPSKVRSLYGQIEFVPMANAASADPAVINWRPNSLPEHVAQLCTRYGVKFLDATPCLREASQSGLLPYNAIFDTHLNKEGCRLVGELLAEALSAD